MSGRTLSGAMDDASLAALNDAIRDQDAQWEAELKDPALRIARLRREYRHDQLRIGVPLGLVWALGLLLWSSFGWAPQLWSVFGGLVAATAAWFAAIVAMLSLLTIGVIGVLLRRRTDYRAQLANPPSVTAGAAARPRPTTVDLPTGLRGEPPPPEE